MVSEGVFVSVESFSLVVGELVSNIVFLLISEHFYSLIDVT